MIEHKIIKFIIVSYKIKQQNRPADENSGGNLSLFVSFPVFCPEACNAEGAIEKKEEGKDDFYFLGKILKTGTDKHKYSQDEIQQDDEPGEILGEFLHDDYG